MVPVETQETTDSLPTAQTKSDITRLDVPRTVASTNGQKKDVCDTVMPPELPLNVFYQEIPEEFAFPFPDPASTLQIQGSARSDQVTYCFFKRLFLFVGLKFHIFVNVHSGSP